MSKTTIGTDGKCRCAWCDSAPEFNVYHDTEWGFPVTDDRRLFKKICLEGFQSGLSWRTILTKRENFRAAFEGFDFYKLATFDDKDVERLLQDAGIIRHRGKIEAANEVAIPQTMSTSPTSIALSKDLKKRGWKFVGPTTVFAFMQAMGLINDHADGCFLRPVVDDIRRSFVRPV